MVSVSCKIALYMNNRYGYYMPTNYDGLYAWMDAAFGGRPFTTATFRETFPSPDPAKVLSDLRRLGYLASPRRAWYRVVPPERRLADLRRGEESAFGLPGRSGLPHAYCDETAVTIWTGGGYWTGFTRGFRPLHLQVRAGDLDAWKRFFRAARARATVAGDRETLFGVVHVLHPVPRVRSVDRGGVRVVPLKEVLAYAASRPYLFEPVLPMLRDLMDRGDA